MAQARLARRKRRCSREQLTAAAQNLLLAASVLLRVYPGRAAGQEVFADDRVNCSREQLDAGARQHAVLSTWLCRQRDARQHWCAGGARRVLPGRVWSVRVSRRAVPAVGGVASHSASTALRPLTRFLAYAMFDAWQVL